MGALQEFGNLLLHTIFNSDADLGLVESIAWTPDGSAFASVSKKWDSIKNTWVPEKIKLWSHNGQFLYAFDHSQEVHAESISSIAWSPAGHLLALGSNHGLIQLCTRGGRLLKTWAKRGSDSRVGDVCIAWSPNGQMLAMGSWGDSGGITVWSRYGRELATFAGHSYINSVAWSPDSQTLASDNFGKIQLWQSNGKLLAEFNRSHGQFLSPVSWSPDGKILASGDLKNTIKLRLIS